MTQQEQIDALAADIRQVLHRYQHEFELPYASVVGVIEMVKQDILDEMLFDFNRADDDDLDEPMPF